MDSARYASERAQSQPWYQPIPALLPIVIATVCLLSLLLLVQISGVTTSGYDVRRLEQERSDWYNKNYQLEAEIAGLQSIDRVEGAAKERLRMVPATTRLFVQTTSLPDATPKQSELPPTHIKEKTRNKDSSNFLDNMIDSLFFGRDQGMY